MTWRRPGPATARSFTTRTGAQASPSSSAVGFSTGGGEVARYIGRHGTKNAFDCIKAFSETDHTEDLKKFNVPTLFIHGDDDQIVPIGASAQAAVKIAPKAQLRVYPGAPHGLCTTHKDQVNADLLSFLKT